MCSVDDESSVIDKWVNYFQDQFFIHDWCSFDLNYTTKHNSVNIFGLSWFAQNKWHKIFCAQLVLQLIYYAMHYKSDFHLVFQYT